MHEVRGVDNGYFALFMKTGAPAFYLAAQQRVEEQTIWRKES